MNGAPDPVESIVAQCLERIETEGEVALDEACRQHPELADEIRRRVNRLVDAGFTAKVESREQIGPYRILERLGEGGMGVVYLAEQRTPVRRRVALKLVRRGMDTERVLRRFEAERQALALMNHDNIARIFDAGSTDDGLPFFVMEHVPGLPINEYGDRHRLSIEERLELFVKVCTGVQHAHQRGIIHRDLKPSNVLVLVEEGRLQPKIIDFGLARATDRQLVQETIHTETGEVVGTPEYMSPEQAEMSSQDIDTRTDVYSLGVLLYELLTGALPFEPGELRQGGILEARRRIREDEPPRPSTRLTTLRDRSGAVAQARRTDIATLRRRLKSDLDWVVMRALEKDRTRRYETASELAADVRRYLRDEPVLAGPPTFGYRAAKFCKRYRLQVATAALVLAALVVGLVVSVVFYREAEQARARESQARRAAQDNAREAQERAEAEARERARADEALQRFDLLAAGIRLDAVLDQVGGLPPARPEHRERLRQWVADAEQIAATRGRLVAAHDALEADATERDGELVFPRGAERFLHAALTTLIGEFDELVHPEHGALRRVRRDLDWAERVGDLTVEGGREAAWTAARVAVLRGDGQSAGTLYREANLELRPQTGLVPIGKNPNTGLWEFHHLRSAADPGLVPERARDGEITMTPDLGMIFVLLPGGAVRLGAQRDDPNAPHFDPFVQDREEPVREVVLPPFFISKFELTQAQWERLTGGEVPSVYAEGWTDPVLGTSATRTNPVESVSWTDCMDVLRGGGLTLPTLDQWEYAARAGAPTPWCTGADVPSLNGHANLADRTAAAVTDEWTAEAELEDGFVVHAPVGRFLPNAFGLHDVHGNVFEWCRDADEFDAPKRGGAFAYQANRARLTSTSYDAIDSRTATTGLRPVRAVDR